MINIQASDLKPGMVIYTPEHGHLTVRGTTNVNGCNEMAVMFVEYPYYLQLRKDARMQVMNNILTETQRYLRAHPWQDPTSENHQIIALRYALKGMRVRGRQDRFVEMFDEHMARHSAERKKMLDTSKKYKVGSVVYKLSFPGAGVWRDEGYSLGIIDPVMQQLYDDGLALEFREPLEKTITVAYDSNGYQTTKCSCYASCLIRDMAGCISPDLKPVANRTFDLIIKERV